MTRALSVDQDRTAPVASNQSHGSGPPRRQAYLAYTTPSDTAVPVTVFFPASV